MRAQAAHFLATCGASAGANDGPLGSPSNIRVHSLASRVGQSQSTKMATVTFVNVPPILLERTSRRQSSFPFMHQDIHSTITIDREFSGFTVLNDVQPDDHVLE